MNSAAKSDGASGWMAGDGSSTWMIVAPASASALQLRAQDRHERLGRGVALAVDLARAGPQPARQRVRAGERDLERAGRAGPRGTELGDDAEAVRRGDRLEDLEPVLLVVAAGAEPAIRRERPGRRSGGGRTRP